MSYFSRSRPWSWLAAGLVLGWLVSRFWPSTPLHAVSTDRAENIVLATGLVDNEVEAVFLLDAQTGILRAGVPSMFQPMGGFQSVWEGNLIADLATVVTQVNTAIRTQNAGRKAGATLPEIQIPQTPKFMMATGLLDIRRQGPIRPGRTLVYVAEANTGIILAYALPWNPNLHVANRPFRGRMQLWAADKLATAIVPAEE